MRLSILRYDCRSARCPSKLASMKASALAGSASTPCVIVVSGTLAPSAQGPGRRPAPVPERSFRTADSLELPVSEIGGRTLAPAGDRSAPPIMESVCGMKRRVRKDPGRLALYEAGKAILAKGTGVHGGSPDSIAL